MKIRITYCSGKDCEDEFMDACNALDDLESDIDNLSDEWGWEEISEDQKRQLEGIEERLEKVRRLLSSDAGASYIDAGLADRDDLEDAFNRLRDLEDEIASLEEDLR